LILVNYLNKLVAFPKRGVFMKTLIVYTHPGTKGHCSTILEAVKDDLSSCSVLDLYEMKFDPVLTEEELKMTPKPKFKGIQQKIKNADKLIFIYPHWWGGMPAVLKGFFERVFTHGFAFKFKGKMPKPLLEGKEAIVFKTTGGPTIMHKLIGNRDSKIIRKEILGFCGIKTRVIQIGSCWKLNEKKAKKIKRIVNKELSQE